MTSAPSSGQGSFALDPETLDKYLYIRKTPTWFVRVVFSLGAIAWILVGYGYSQTINIDMFYRWFIVPIAAVFVIYNVCSFVLNLYYHRFNLSLHTQKVAYFQGKKVKPSVDVFLPICGEELDVLDNTWKYVSQLRYSNFQVYVLDDSKEEQDAHRTLAESYGFSYIERPNKGEMKKAGNLKYGFKHTKGDFIAILDADFAPHPDFLVETLPYAEDPVVGIVQTPQYFESSGRIHEDAPIAYGAARAQEPFYRITQVARDRLGAAHCCGTCAIYRREALVSIGGFVQMSHSEDAHTGFALTANHWVVRYIPVILSIGICPDNAYAFFHQQHRWCLGNVVMVLDRNFWSAKIPWRIKFCYITGFLYNLHYPLLLLFSFQLFWVLIIYNPYISFAGTLLFLPSLMFTIFCVFWLPLSQVRWGCFYADFMKAYSNTHAFLSILTNKSVGWIATNAKHAGISSAFLETVGLVALYVFASFMLLAFALRGGDIHLLVFRYYAVQFWIFYNLMFSVLLLWHMYKAIESPRRYLVTSGAATTAELTAWQLKTACAYLLLLTIVFLCIVYA
jgi:cellulose synthase/poly-beta-1,6-N-acetylglucosamine synthase-like glycosyltransferase